MSNIPGWKKLYERRKANGECPKCGNEMDREGHYCGSCLKKRNAYVRETRAFMRKMGICPQCQKNSLVGEQKICLECLAKQAENRANHKQTFTDEQKQKRNEVARKRYQDRIAKGICTHCGKFKADYGKKKCKICLDKDATVHRLRITI